ncbi:N-acetyltransferase [Paenibacillus sp. BC26]|uniref:GNAT family N-acetyltransferase n=1 Tax=Paenibacillus sp. BC26 TaxID=1881032 RepID=UPI0008E27A24|nr:GNAT family N-acetyltransferase [Paenibacillus sp. BC26]SFS59975.1 Ribosomal protein S18 acetylase RimI [Paenibacillus sp. BC26]
MIRQTIFQVQPLKLEEEARRISSFFLSDDSFDDVNHTPGEIQHYLTNPLNALTSDYEYRFVQNEQNEMIGVIGYLQNEQQTGGYYLDYLVVHKKYRNHGIASLLLTDMTEVLRSRAARYLLTYTCDTDIYKPVRRLFERQGFTLAGRCPDYYFEGEDRLIYSLKLNSIRYEEIIGS